MILTHIIAKNDKQAQEIITILMEKKLFFHAATSEKIVYQNAGKQGHPKAQKRILIIGKTKALLFNTINHVLQEHFPKNMPMLYAVPIIYMNETLATTLKSNTAKV